MVVGPMVASMEPRPLERGNWILDSDNEPIRQLQWSHVISNVETIAKSERDADLARASMEPRPLERGNLTSGWARSSRRTCFNGATSSRTWKPECCCECGCWQWASMEPRPLERGNRDYTN